MGTFIINTRRVAPETEAPSVETGAAAKGLGDVAPFYVEQESPVPPGGLPKPGKLIVTLPDNHLQYALTWYGLALVLVVMLVTWAYGQSREQQDGA